MSCAVKPPTLNRIRQRRWLVSITSKGKVMRKILGICALVLLLTSSAVAGEIPNDKPAPPPPTSTVQETPTEGEIPNDEADSLTQIALDLLAALPSFF